MGKKSFSREAAEGQEGLSSVSNDLPDNRVQTTQQIQDTDAALDTKGDSSSFSTKKASAKGQTLKQQVISEAITGSNASAGMGISASGRGVSGTANGVLGANNSTPFADQSRKDTRVGKKLDRIANKLNYTPSELSLLPVDESKPLADAADKDQGYNGTYRNEFGRSQKIMGAVPGDLMFQRSVDFIMKDKLYFVEGQQVYQSGDDRTSNDPQRVADIHSEDGSYIDTSIHSGNYLHRAMHVGLNNQGKATYCYFDVDDITHDAVSADDANVASAHRLIKSNVAELDRMKMDSKAGDEKADIWSPLPRAIKDPTKWSYLLSSIEADTGAYCHLAYSKATTNMAYQLNRGPKDGLSTIIPAIEQCIGWRSTVDKSTDFQDTNITGAAESLSGCFTKAHYRAGDPSLMIAAYDSDKKYNNKADLLLQPRGWRMHLQTADNNMNALKVPKEYANVFAGTEVFSTIDREYDPLLPICMTDKANLITVHNFNELAAFYNEAGYKRIDGKLSYTGISNGYANTKVILAKSDAMKKMGWTSAYLYKKYTLIDGVDFDSESTTFTINADANTKTDGTYSVIVSPIQLNVTDEDSDYYGYTLVTTLTVASVTTDIAIKVPTIASGVTASVLTYKDEKSNNWRYINCNPIAYNYKDLRSNYIVEVKHPLIEGIISYINEGIGGKFYSLIHENGYTDELFVPFIFSTQYMTLAQLIICAATPWIQRVRYNSMKDIIYYEDNIKEYPFEKLASLKEVPFKNYVNFVYESYDSPLETKIMNPVQAISWVMPEFFWKVATEKYVLPWYFCENDLNTDGTVDDDASTMCMPSIRSGIRLSFLDTLYSMDEKDIRLSLDRMTKTFLRDEDISSKLAYKYGRMTDGQILANLGDSKLFTIGKILSAPRELGLQMDAPLGVLTRDPATSQGFSTALKSLTDDGTNTSYRIKVFTNVNTIQHPSILADTGVNVNRAANYSQKWFELTANSATSNTDLSGLIFGLGDDAGSYSPFAALGTGASANNGITVRSLQRSIYTRLQLLPFVISPFDSISNDTIQDIYDFAYYFGLCGFRASDYRESVYNREKEVVNQGLLFIEDPWILSSPIIRGATESTGVKLAKGYMIK